MLFRSENSFSSHGNNVVISPRGKGTGDPPPEYKLPYTKIDSKFGILCEIRGEGKYTAHNPKCAPRALGIDYIFWACIIRQDICIFAMESKHPRHWYQQS